MLHLAGPRTLFLCHLSAFLFSLLHVFFFLLDTKETKVHREQGVAQLTNSGTPTFHIALLEGFTEFV